MFKQYYRPPALGCLIYVAIYFCASCSKEPHTATASAAQVQASIAAIDKLIDAGQFENALRVARELEVKAPNDPLTSEVLARALLSQCNANPSAQLRVETAAAYAKAAAARPTSPGLQSAAGMAAYSAGNMESAIRYHQKAAKLEPGNPQHLYLEAMMWNASAQPNFSIELFERAQKLDPHSPEIEMGWAEAMSQAGDAARAKEHMQRARTLASQDSTIRYRAASLLRSLGSPDEAAEMLLGGVSIGSATTATCELCAQCLSEAGKHAQSAEVWERLAAMSMMRPEHLLEAARSWSRAGQQETALILLEKARQANAPQAYFELARSEIMARQKQSP